MIKSKLDQLLSHKGFIRYSNNIAWLFCDKVIKIVSVLFVTIWVARYLGPEDFGILSYAINFAFFFTAMANLGLDNIVVRELVNNAQDGHRLLGSAFILRIIGAIVALAGVFVIVTLSNNDDLTRIVIFIITSSVIFHSFNVIVSYNQANVMSKYTALASSISLIISSIVKVLLILVQAPLIAFGYVIAFEAMLLAIGLIYFYQKHSNFSILRWSSDWQVCKSLLKNSWPLMFSGILVMIYMKIDQIMIKEMLGFEANGQYAAAVTISEGWYFIPVIITSSLFPAVANAKKRSTELYYQRLQHLYDLMVGISIAIAVPITILSHWLIEFLYGNAFILASDVLIIHIWSGIFVALGVARSNWILAENLQIFAMAYLGIGTIVNVILNYVLIPKIGINGAAYATLLSYIISSFIAPAFFVKTRTSFFMILKAMCFMSLILKMKDQLTKS